MRRKLTRLANDGVRRRLATTDVRAVPPSRITLGLVGGVNYTDL